MHLTRIPKIVVARAISHLRRGQRPATLVALGAVTVLALGGCGAGAPATSSRSSTSTAAPATGTLRVHQQSVSTVSFSRVLNGLRCGRHRERVRIAARSVRVRRHGRWVRRRRAAQTRTVRKVFCRLRYVQRRVRVQGRWANERLPMLPHTVRTSRKRVAFGVRARINGWLGTSQGLAFGGQRVRILTAPNNGRNEFRQVGTVITGPDGRWSARLPAGPSRMVEAVFDGAAAVGPSTGRAKLLVAPRRHPRPVTHPTGKSARDGRRQ